MLSFGCFKHGLHVCPRHPSGVTLGMWSSQQSFVVNVLEPLHHPPSCVITVHGSGGFIYLLCLLILPGGTRVKGYGSISSEVVKPFIHCCINLGWAGLGWSLDPVTEAAAQQQAAAVSRINGGNYLWWSSVWGTGSRPSVGGGWDLPSETRTATYQRGHLVINLRLPLPRSASCSVTNTTVAQTQHI